VVPVGTIVKWQESGEEHDMSADLEQAGQQVVVIKGGSGGKGNVHFATSTSQAPKIAQRGAPGEDRLLILELRLIADIGIIGYPNVGKSTLLTSASAARPKIASYPFTTCEPVLGVVEVGMKTFVLAEIPGLIEDAHLGRGLGHDFLRHIMRTRMLIHEVNGTSESPVDDMIRVNNELALFDPELGKKPQIMAVNKIDLPEVRARLDEIKREFSEAGISVVFISAESGEGVSQLMKAAWQMLEKIADQPKPEVAVTPRVFQPKPRGTGISVYKDGDIFVIEAPKLERIISADGRVSSEVRWQLRKQLDRQGANKTLEKAGIKQGDKVRCGNLEWEWW